MREEMKLEAIERMKMLSMSKSCINAFKKGKVWESERIGALYEVNDQEQQIIDKFEKDSGGVVYHIIHNMTQFGELYSILYVSKHKDEWEIDRQDIKENIVFAYVYNKTCEDFSEYGSIMIRPSIGGLMRIS